MYLLQNKIVSTAKVFFLAVLMIASFSALASEEHAPGEKKFNAGEMIAHHITDAHEWHIVGHVSIPLPVILYAPEKGFTCGMYTTLEHGHMEGYRLNEHHEIESVDGSKFYDISLTKNTTSLLLSLILMVWVFLSVAKAYKRREGQAPKGLQSLVEPIIVFIRDDVAKASIGTKKYMKFMPYLLTAFFFIWINNLLGVIPIFPGGANVTGNLAVTLSLAVLTFLIVTYSANKSYWQHVFAMPGVPIGVLVLLTPIEILGVFLRPFVLMIRLFANMLAGHIIILSFFALVFIFGEMNAGLGFGVGIFSLVFTIFMTLLELLVTFLQAYVFTLLSAIYIGAAVEEHHHEEHEAHLEHAHA
jgi:F-type H+-transporting ATPase subunit a